MDNLRSLNTLEDIKFAVRRIDELEEKLLSAKMDGYDMAKHEYRDRIEELEAKLGRAEWLLCDAMVQLRDGKIRTRRNRAGLIEAFLKELKEQNNE